MTQAPPRIRLIHGPRDGELLVSRAAEELLEAERVAHGGLDVTDVTARDLGEQGLPDIRTPSLFGAPQAVVIREAHQLPAARARDLLAALEEPLEALVLLLTTRSLEPSGQEQSQGQGQGDDEDEADADADEEEERLSARAELARAIKRAGGETKVSLPPPFREGDWKQLVRSELERHGRTVRNDAVDALFAVAGMDLAAIAQKAASVVAATSADPLTAEHVEAAVEGVGTATAFQVADAALVDRDAQAALRALRGALGGGAEPLMVLGMLASRVRATIAVAAFRHEVPEERERLREERERKYERDLARYEERVAQGKKAGRKPSAPKDPTENEALASFASRRAGIKVSPGQVWLLDKIRKAAAPGELTRAMRVLADADAEMKGGDLPPELVLERAVLALAEGHAGRDPRRVVPDVARTG